MVLSDEIGGYCFQFFRYNFRSTTYCIDKPIWKKIWDIFIKNECFIGGVIAEVYMENQSTQPVQRSKIYTGGIARYGKNKNIDYTHDQLDVFQGSDQVNVRINVRQLKCKSDLLWKCLEEESVNPTDTDHWSVSKTWTPQESPQDYFHGFDFKETVPVGKQKAAVSFRLRLIDEAPERN